MQGGALPLEAWAPQLEVDTSPEPSRAQRALHPKPITHRKFPTHVDLRQFAKTSLATTSSFF